MAGVKALRKIQLGKESGGAAGTAVPATTIWRGMGLLEDLREITHVAESVGIALPTNRAYIPKLGCKVTFDPIEATFQQLPYILEAGVSIESPTQDGGGTDYIYAYAFPTTALNTLETYTIEMGDNQLAQETDYAFVESFKLSGNAGEGVMMEATWIGRSVVDASFTGALSVPALTPDDHILFGGSNLYIDAVGGTIGTTEIVSTLLSFELDVTTGYKAKWTNLGKDFDFVYFDGDSFSATLKLVFEHNAAADAQRDLYEVATPRLIRLKFTGGAVATGGTVYDNNTLIINAAGIYTAMPFGDIDGNATVEAEMKIGYDLTGTKGLDFVVVNELSALP
jgi:hypothetical protein